MVRVDLRTVTLNIPPQEVITRDNVPSRVNAVAYFRVLDPNRAIVEVENFLLATSQIAQTALRSVLGKAELDQLLSERERLNEDLQKIIDEQTEPWGVKVSIVEIKDVEIPEQMQRAMARQAEAERERTGEDHQLRGRVPGGPEAHRRRRHHQHQPRLASAPLPADPDRDRQQPEHDGRLPPADGHDQAVPRVAMPRRRAAARAAAPQARLHRLPLPPVPESEARSRRHRGKPWPPDQRRAP